jgi:hypothetical protein
VEGRGLYLGGQPVVLQHELDLRAGVELGGMAGHVRAAGLAAGESVVNCSSPLNVLKLIIVAVIEHVQMNIVVAALH